MNKKIKHKKSEKGKNRYYLEDGDNLQKRLLIAIFICSILLLLAMVYILFEIYNTNNINI